jgi:GT2 family glycosyltransferase
MSTPTVAVVIVNYNAGDLLCDVMDGLAAQTVMPSRVIVVDNGSADGSTERAVERLAGAEVLDMGFNAGFAPANNRAVDMASDCEWVALLNPDAIPEPSWLEELLAAAARHTDVTMFGSLLVLADDPGTVDGAGDVLHVGGLAWRGLHGRSVAMAPKSPVEVFSPCAAAALYRRDAWMDIGGFEERYFCYQEDTDLAFRLRLRGARCLLIPSSVARHHGSALTGRESDFTIYHSHRNLEWTWLRDMPLPALIRSIPHHLLTVLLTVAWYTSQGQGRVILRAKRDALLGLGWAVRSRRAIQATRTVDPDAVWPMLARGTSAYATAGRRASRYISRMRRAGRS